MKPGGVPDTFRAARLLFKDFVTGKLLFCLAPPGVHQDTFHKVKVAHDDDDEMDMALEESFPELRMQSGVHVRGVLDKKKVKKKKEKARRMYKTPYQS